MPEIYYHKIALYMLYSNYCFVPITKLPNYHIGGESHKSLWTPIRLFPALAMYSNSSICIIYENAYSSFSSGLQEDLIIQAFKLLFTIQDKCLEIKF